jgi:hypothetical protein
MFVRSASGSTPTASTTLRLKATRGRPLTEWRKKHTSIQYITEKGALRSSKNEAGLISSKGYTLQAMLNYGIAQVSHFTGKFLLQILVFQKTLRI